MIQELDNNVLDLFKQRGFYPYKYMSNFEKFKEELPSKETFYTSNRQKNYWQRIWKFSSRLEKNLNKIDKTL